jgi:dihydroorotate dehydrogenase electron transfer subunit
LGRNYLQIEGTVKQIFVFIISNTEVMPEAHLLWLQAPDIAEVAQPGQFVMVRCGEGYDPLLRRPFSIHQVANGGQIALLFNIVGRGTEWLSQCREGDTIDLLGPLGNGFSLQPSSRKLLLVGGGIGIAPLVFLAEKAIGERRSITLLIGARDASLLYPRSLLPSSIKLVTATEKGKRAW